LLLFSLQLVFGLPYLIAEDTNIQCIERLYLPGFGAIARLSQKDGTVEAKIHIGKAGAVGKRDIELTGPDQRLVDEVRIFLELSSFSTECEGKTVVVSFKFIREGDPVDNPVPLFSFSPPNRFEVRSLPQRLR